ncbi:MAG: ATP--guanido phosphotransferase [Peptoniphilaceae bacterium]|nr:ATP--guanido phosphotransferase [Peptoniphilaceae bacterium]MDY6018347.1 ATP--guanido phosphotransferase [Anaerococcus sp.]
MIEYSKDIILNTNLSIKRNIEAYDFPTSMTREKSLEVISAFKDIYKDELVLLEDIDEISLNEYINDGLLSEDCLEKDLQIGLVLKDDYIITINDMDHIGINVRNFNMDLLSAYKKARHVEEFLDYKFDFAFSPEYGYLTSQARNAGLGLDITYKVFLFGLVDSAQTYYALKTSLANEGMYFTKFLPKYYNKYATDLYLIKNFGNYRENVEEYLADIEKAVDTLVRNERRFRRDYQVLNRISRDDIIDEINIIETNLEKGNLKSLENITKALYGLKKYKALGFKTKLDNDQIDYLIFNTTKNKYKGDRDKERYEFLNSYMEGI